MFKIFISYSWDSQEHTNWVDKFVHDLEEYKEFHLIYDKYDLNASIDKNYFMEKGIFASDLILVICTEFYAQKANEREGGVGIETFMATIRQWEELEEKKESNIFAILKGDKSKSIPNYLKAKKYINFQNDEEYEKSFNFLVKEKIKN